MLGFFPVGSTPLGSNSPHQLLYATVAQTTGGVALYGELQFEAISVTLDLTVDSASLASEVSGVITGQQPGITLADSIGDINLIRSSSQIGSGPGWSGYWRLPAFTTEADPFGGNDAVSFPLSECTGSPTANAAGFLYQIPESQAPLVLGELTVGVWMRADAPTYVIFGKSDGYASVTVLVGTEWAFYSVTRNRTIDQISVGDRPRRFQVYLRRDLGTNGDLPPSSRVYFSHPQTNHGPVPLDYVRTANGVASPTAFVAQAAVNANLLLDSGAALSTGSAHVSHEARVERFTGSVGQNLSAQTGIVATLQSGTLDGIGYTLEGLNVFTGYFDVTLGAVSPGTVKNILPYSDAFLTGAGIANYQEPVLATPAPGPGPNGEGSVTRFVRSSTSVGRTYYGRVIAKPASPKDYAFSVAAKYVNSRYLSMRVQGGYPSRVDLIVDLLTDTVVSFGPTANFGPASYFLERIDEWLRVHVLLTTDSASTVGFYVSTSNSPIQIDGFDTSVGTEVHIANYMVSESRGIFPFVATNGTSLEVAFENTAQTVVGLTLDKDTGQPAFVSIGYASTDVTVDASTGAVSINADAKPTVTVTVIGSTNPATSQAAGGTPVDARVQKSTGAASPSTTGQVTPSATFNKSASPATALASGGPLGQSVVEGTLGSVSVIALGAAPLSVDFAVTTTSPVMNALLQISIVGQGAASSLPVEILAEAGPLVIAALEQGASAAQIVSEAAPVVNAALTLQAGAIGRSIVGEPVVAASLGEELADTIINALLENVISAASIKALSSLTHNAVGAAVVTSSVATHTQAVEINFMVYRIVRRVLMTPRTLRTSTEKPLADFTPTYS